MTERDIKDITDTCFASHKEELDQANKQQIKKVKSIIYLQVTLPVTILLALGFWMLQTTFSIGKESAKHQAITNEKVDVMGRSIMEETRLRRLSDDKIEIKLNDIEKKLDDNLLYIYQNSMFKSRGDDLPYKIK